MKLTYNQKETLVAILNESDSDNPFVMLGLNFVLYNQNTIRALKKRGLVEYVDTGIEIPNPNNITFLNGTKKGTFKKLTITKLGKEVAFKELK